MTESLVGPAGFYAPRHNHQSKYPGQKVGDTAGYVQCPHSSEDCVDEVDCTCTLPAVQEAIKNGAMNIDYAVTVRTRISRMCVILAAVNQCHRT